MSRIAIVYALFPDAESAQSVARLIISERLAACANVLAACTSIYEWDGAVQENAEIPVLFKTGEARAAALIARIAELHPYDVPAILTWPAGATSAFAEWVDGGAQ